MDDMRISNVEKAVENVENSGAKVGRVAGFETRIKETDCAIEITTRCFEWAIGAVGGGGTVGVG